MTRLLTTVVALAFALAATNVASAAPDQYLGDTSIYGAPGALQPNVLIIIDNSGSMQDKVPGESYDPAVTYPAAKACGSNGNAVCNSSAVYRSDRTEFIGNVTSVTTSCNGANPRELLTTTGLYRGRSLSSGGSCSRSGTTTYYLGNYLNYLRSPSATQRPKIDIAKDVVKELVTTTSGVKFGLMVFNYQGSTGQGGKFLSTTVPGAGTTRYVSTVKDMDAVFTGSITNRAALKATVDTLTPQGNTPLGETLFEAMRYFRGEASAFGNTIGITDGRYTSPVEAHCQLNTIIFVSDGMANADNDPVLKTLCSNGDCDGDGIEPNNLNHVLDDVAKALQQGARKVTTYTIGFGLTGADADAVALLKRAADSNHGNGAYYNAGSQQELSDALNEIIINIFSVDSSIAAPVVPVSPENRTYGSGSIYMAFFKPENSSFWNGNLKKYGILPGSTPAIIDATGAFATYMDENNDHIDDNTKEALPPNALNGTFRATAKSFWSTAADGSHVDQGGAGQLLQARAAGNRTIYTMTPTGTRLVPFTIDNASITAGMLGVPDAVTRNDLIAFVLGQDVYDEDMDGNTTENRSWTMGDVLHSKPLVINYAPYQVTTANTANCGKNRSVIYAGGNDGMLHAFRDCDGSELWGFIPPVLLENLKYLRGQNHTYFVDGTPVAYVHDVNRDGTIDPAKGDRVILIFGMRRGGGESAVRATGSYFALDVSTPESPVFLWRVGNPSPTSGVPATAGFEELAQSWSEPKLVKMKISTNGVTADKIVAVIGAGYDNVNEDGRYGATQTFSGTATVLQGEPGDGPATSSGAAPPLNPRGRGIYLVEVATLTATGLDLSAGGTKIHGFTYGTAAPYSAMTFSFPSEVAAIDALNNGYTSRLYAADTGGNIWRFDIGDPLPSKWTARRLFSANPGSGGASDVGRKIFSKPAVVTEADHRMIFFGTGDREHPLNTAVVDRIYAIKDKGQTQTLTESNLMNLTENQLQTTTITSGPGSRKDILAKLNDAANYGWYIKLNKNTGEKVLSPPLLFNKVAYFTTHTPGTVVSADPCESPGNLGTARLYSLNYKTAESVRPDPPGPTPPPREEPIGPGIPSPPVVIITPGGESTVVVNVGTPVTFKAPPGGGIIPLYWRQK